MEEFKRSHRGRPRKSPMDSNMRFAIIVLLYAVEKQLMEDGQIEHDIETLLIGSAWDDAYEHILKTNRKIWGSSIYNDRPKCGHDFFKNLINIKKGKEECDKPSLKALDLLVQYAFSTEKSFQGWKWKDYLEIFKQCSCDINTMFFDPKQINIENLTIDDILIVGWVPQHFYVMSYRGNYKFKIIIAGDGMLHSKNDEFYAESFEIKHPTIKQTIQTAEGSFIEKDFPAYAPPTIFYQPHAIESL